MLSSTPTKDYLPLRNRTCDSSMFPHSTPPRLVSASASTYDSPMLTPSPLRQRPLFPRSFHARDHNEGDDLFLQSPYKSPAQAHRVTSAYTTKPQPINADDEEGAIFLASSGSTSFSTIFPSSSSQPLRTPVKQVHRSALSIKHLNAAPCATTGNAPRPAPGPTARVGVGTKRKSSAHIATTPLRKHTLTPLKVASSQSTDDPLTSGILFDRLAPLAAPKFVARTPHSKAETESHLRKQTATLTKLRITDPAEEFGMDNDSGCEMEEDDGDALFMQGSVRLKGKSSSLSRATGREALVPKGKEKEEVAEAISPGGHINKRRARSRPVSAELLGIARRSPTPSPSKQSASYTNAFSQRPAPGGMVVFPSGPKLRGRTSSSSSSDAGSPLPRRRVTGSATSVLRLSEQGKQAPYGLSQRAPLSRMESVSSATLFFGPAIPQADNPASGVRSRLNTTVSSSSGTPVVDSLRPKIFNRHSYSGHAKMQSWNTIQTRSMLPSPRSSPLTLPDANTSGGYDDDEDMFSASGPQDSSFMFSLTEGTPSPRKKADTAGLPRKYKPRDSGIVLTDDEDDMMGMGSSLSTDYLNVMPRASTSVSSIYSDADEGLITPGTGPDSGSGWPAASVFVTGTDDHGDLGAEEGYVDVDAFIMRTLADAAKGPQEAAKKPPGTPVKKIKISYLTNARPWQSAVAAKVGFGDWDAKKGKVPRKSLPAAFPALGMKPAGKPLDDQNTDSEGEEDSPSGRKEKYVGLGLGRPPPPIKEGMSAVSRTRWLMRRSSSGAFSSGSDSASVAGTPTRMKGKDWHLPMPKLPAQFAPSNNSLKLSPVRSASNSSSSSVTTLNSPTTAATRHLPHPGTERHPGAPRASLNLRRLSEPFAEEQPGRFEREFVEVDEVGSGEFGKVIKVRSKIGKDEEVFAVKKSKRFEGPRHRLRLREEVDILKHLSHAAREQRRHPNVLAYIDSWEEDEALYIRTELCESGNLARFLWEYGRVFPRLDEARVWKIIVDLSNGLRFIHDAGVIHLDLKPSNIFVTAEGRFKIGDFGMASLWPRPPASDGGGFEREGDKVYLAPEVLQGRYGKAADIFSFGMTMLETASNIVVPDQGEAWHRLRQEDFSQIDLDESSELLELLQQMMRTDPTLRINVHAICDHPVVARARTNMERVYLAAKRNGTSVFAASPLSSVPRGFLEEILDRPRTEGGAMDLSP